MFNRNKTVSEDNQKPVEKKESAKQIPFRLKMENPKVVWEKLVEMVFPKREEE